MVTATALTVSAADRATWRRMLGLADARELWIERADISHIVSSEFEAFNVESYSARTNPEREPHSVLVWTDGDRTHVACDCEYGALRQRPCSHAALAIQQTGAWPFDVHGWPCPKCGLLFDTADQVARHVALAHTPTTPKPSLSLDLSDARVNPLLRGRK